LTTGTSATLDFAVSNICIQKGQPTASTSAPVALLMRNAEQTLETNTLIERVWGYADGDPIVLKNVVYRLRKKLEPDPKQHRYLVWLGDGYAFSPQSQDS
jgi:DNA-binding response OmpR family regulator